MPLLTLHRLIFDSVAVAVAVAVAFGDSDSDSDSDAPKKFGASFCFAKPLPLETRGKTGEGVRKEGDSMQSKYRLLTKLP